jgi:hypothetical protein
MPDTQDTREQYPEAAPRRPAEGEVLRARPVQGEIDHAALTREVISRFPNILAELAK